MRCAMTSEIQYPDRQQKLQKQPLILLYHRIRYQLHVHHTVAYTVLLGGRDRQYNLKLYNSFFTNDYRTPLCSYKQKVDISVG